MKDPFEVHVTLDYVEPNTLQFELLTSNAKLNGFRVAKLFKLRGDGSDLDTFCTGRFATYELAESHMQELVQRLYSGFKVRREKIERIMYDRRFV